MNSTYPALPAFTKLRPGWEFYGTSSSGLSGGMLSRWNPLIIKWKSFHTFAGILLKARFTSSSTSLSILNCYGPYLYHESFWNLVARGGLLSLPNLILAGDLNITLNGSEVWGTKALPDPLGPFFTKHFSDHQLADVAPTCAGPTWRNGRLGAEGIRKRLDRFFLSFNLVNLLPRHRVWSYPSVVSDHYPALF